MSAEFTVGEELEGVVSCAVHVSIDSQSTLATLERLRKTEIGVPGTAVAARFGRSRFDGTIGDDDFAVSKRGVLECFRELRERLTLSFPSRPSLDSFFSRRVVDVSSKKFPVQRWTSNKVILANEMVRGRLVYIPDPFHKIQMFSRERRLHSLCRSSVLVFRASRLFDAYFFSQPRPFSVRNRLLQFFDGVPRCESFAIKIVRKRIVHGAQRRRKHRRGRS